MLSATLDQFDGLVAELSSLSIDLGKGATRIHAPSLPFPPNASKPTVCVPPTMRRCHPPLPSNEVSEKTLRLDEDLRDVLEELEFLAREEVGKVEVTEQVTPADSGCSLSVSSHRENPEVGRPTSLHSAYSADGSSNFNDSASFLSNESRDVTSRDVTSRDCLSFVSNDSRDLVSPVGSEGFRLAEILIKVHSTDETCKTISISDRTRIFDLVAILIKKHRVKLSKCWAIREEMPDLFIERLIEDHVRVFAQMKVWNPASKNKLIFVEDLNRFNFLRQPEIRDSLSTGVFIPNLEGSLFLQSLGKKSWKKYHFVLRASGLYYSTKKKTNKTSDLACLYNLQDVDIFSMLKDSDWKQKLKSPTDFGFALRLSESLIRYLCCDNQLALDNWLLNLRLVKYGKNLLENAERPIILPQSIQSPLSNLSPHSNLPPQSNLSPQSNLPPQSNLLPYCDNRIQSDRIPPRSVSMNLNSSKLDKINDQKSLSNSTLINQSPRTEEGDCSPSRRFAYKPIIPLTNNVSRHFSSKSPTTDVDTDKSSRRSNNINTNNSNNNSKNSNHNNNSNIPPPINCADVRSDDIDWFNRTPTGDFVRFPSPDFASMNQPELCELSDANGVSSADSLLRIQYRFGLAKSSFNRLRSDIDSQKSRLSANNEYPRSNPISLFPEGSARLEPETNSKDRPTKIVKQKRVCFDNSVDEAKVEQPSTFNGDRLQKSRSHDTFSGLKSSGDNPPAEGMRISPESNVYRKSSATPPPPPPQRSHQTRLSLRNSDHHLMSTKKDFNNSFSKMNIKNAFAELPLPPKELLEGL